MPLYEYECKGCGYFTDVMVPLKNYGKVLECPSCGKDFTVKMSKPRFIIY
jgi:putative FmdB family regulatory protein